MFNFHICKRPTRPLIHRYSYLLRHIILRNRLSPHFINKATTAEPIQGDEEILLQSRSKINKRKYGTPQLATEDTETRPREIEAP
jgi:hypothetical protein